VTVRKSVAAIFLLLLLLSIVSGVAWAANISSIQAIRNPDGTVTLKWSGGSLNDTLTITRLTREFGTKRVKVATVMQTDHEWTDASAPQTEVGYELRWNAFNGAKSVWVPEYEPGQGPSAPIEQPGMDMEARRQAYENSADWPERLAGSLVMAIPNWLIKVIGLYDPIELIYMTDLDEPPPGRENLPQPQYEYWHIFSSNEMEALDVFFAGLSRFVPLSLVVVLVAMGLFVLYASANPESKIGFRECLLGFLSGLLLLKFGPYLLGFVFDVNYAIVKQFEYIAGPYLGKSFLASIYNENTASLGSAIVAFVAVFSVGLLNWQYTMRKLTIMLLVGLLPIVAVVSIPPSRRRCLGIWFSEFIAAVFLQAAHAAALTLMILVLNHLGNSSQEFWVKLATIFGLTGMAGLFRRVVGADTLGAGNTLGAGIGAALGMGALFAMGRMLGVGGRSIAGGASAGIGGVASGVARAGLGLTGAVGGALVTGAAMGNPAMGIAGGALLGSKVAGMGASLVRPFEGASVYDPESMREAGTKLFGDNFAGRAVGGALEKGSMYAARLNPAGASAARTEMKNFEAMRERLPHMRLDAAEMRPKLDLMGIELREAKAREAALSKPAEAAFTKKLEASQNLSDIYTKTSLDNFFRAEAQRYPTAADRQKLIDEYKENLATYEESEDILQEAEAARQNVKALQEQYEKMQVDYAKTRIAVVQTEREIINHPLYEQFKNIRGGQTYGGVDSIIRRP